MIGLIRSEVVKFRSVRSTVVLLTVAGALVVLIAVLQARDIVLDRAASVDHGRVTAAVPAHAVAEGDVEIGRQGA